MWKYLVTLFMLFTLQVCTYAQEVDKDSLDSGCLLIEADSLILADLPKCEETIIDIQPKKFCEGYRIQVYFDRNRDKVSLKEKEFELLFPDFLSQIVYQAPNYKLQIGHYIERLNAEKDREKILPKFPESIVILSPTFLCRKAADYKKSKKN